MENEIIISENNPVESYAIEMPPEVTAYENILGFSADSVDSDAGITIVGAGITVNNNFGGDVMLDGTGNSEQFPSLSSYVTVNASQTSYSMRISGNDKNNVIIGGNGENTLFGGVSGINSLTGGSTRDYFMYNGAGRTVITNFTAGRTGNSDIIYFVDDSTSGNISATRNGSTVRMKFGDDTTNENYVSLLGAGSDDSIVQYAVGNSGGIKYAKVSRSTLTYDDEVSYFKTNAGGTVNVNGSNSVNIWMDGSCGQNFEGVVVLNAGNSSGYNTLVGNNNASTSITGGSGNSSLWGGSGVADDTLFGGNGSEMFWYGRFDGNDVILNAASNDTVFLYDLILENVTEARVNGSEIKVIFNSNSAVAVNCADSISPVIMLADKSRWTYNLHEGKWNNV